MEHNAYPLQIGPAGVTLCSIKAKPIKPNTNWCMVKPTGAAHTIAVRFQNNKLQCFSSGVVRTFFVDFSASYGSFYLACLSLLDSCCYATDPPRTWHH